MHFFFSCSCSFLFLCIGIELFITWIGWAVPTAPFWRLVLIRGFVCLFFFLFISRPKKTHIHWRSILFWGKNDSAKWQTCWVNRNASKSVRAIRITKVYEIYQSIYVHTYNTRYHLWKSFHRYYIMCVLYTLFCLVLTSNFKLLAFKI